MLAKSIIESRRAFRQAGCIFGGTLHIVLFIGSPIGSPHHRGNLFTSYRSLVPPSVPLILGGTSSHHMVHWFLHRFPSSSEKPLHIVPYFGFNKSPKINQTSIQKVDQKSLKNRSKSDFGALWLPRAKKGVGGSI